MPFTPDYPIFCGRRLRWLRPRRGQSGRGRGSDRRSLLRGGGRCRLNLKSDGEALLKRLQRREESSRVWMLDHLGASGVKCIPHFTESSLHPPLDLHLSNVVLSVSVFATAVAEVFWGSKSWSLETRLFYAESGLASQRTPSGAYCLVGLTTTLTVTGKSVLSRPRTGRTLTLSE